MKTYVVESDGIAKLAFRAKDDEAAAFWPTSRLSIPVLNANKITGTITVRPATIAEQAEWRAHSVEMQELHYADRQDDDVPCRSDPDPDDYGVLLNLERILDSVRGGWGLTFLTQRDSQGEPGE